MTATKPDLAASVELVGAPWKDSAYYGIAEGFTSYFWDEASQFLGMDLEDEGPQAPATFDTFELLDFDAF